MENDSGFCIDCSHKHRGIAQCNYCDCNWTLVLEEDNMLKKIWNKIKSWLGIA
jgi:hypothetical protein